MRILVATLLAALTAAGSAQAAVCRYDPEPIRTPQEQELLDAIAKRKGWTLPHEPSFVRRVNADPAARRRGFNILDFPMTRREAAYFRLRDRYESDRFLRPLDAYNRRHADSFGGLSIEDDYPRGPYILLHFTDDLERHREAIARVFPLRFVLRQAPYPERELRRIQESIDWAGLRREGIHPLSSWTEPGRVELEVTTARDDAAEVVRGLYGPAVHVTVVAETPTYLLCWSPERYRVGTDGRTLHLTYFGSGSIEPRYAEVVERAGEVRVGVVNEVPHGAVTADRRTYRLSVELSAPLGDRVVRGITTGRRIPRGG